MRIQAVGFPSMRRGSSPMYRAVCEQCSWESKARFFREDAVTNGNNHKCETGIRPYGPGKFDTILDSYVYDLSLDSSDSECGSVDDHGVYYSLLSGPASSWFKDGDPLQEELTADERAFLDEQAGAIIIDDSNGFVTIDYYADDAALDKAWRACEYEIARMDHEAEATVDDETDGAA